MKYVKPKDARSPKDRLTLVDVLLDRGERKGAYALGFWDNRKVILFRWNGGRSLTAPPKWRFSPLGNPQSRGHATWTVLEDALHDAVLALLTPEKRAFAENFLRS